MFAPLLIGDRTSFLSADPDFTPLPEFIHGGDLGLAEFINVALGRTP